MGSNRANGQHSGNFQHLIQYLCVDVGHYDASDSIRVALGLYGLNIEGIEKGSKCRI